MPACQEFMARFSAQSDPNCVQGLGFGVKVSRFAFRQLIQSLFRVGIDKNPTRRTGVPNS